MDAARARRLSNELVGHHIGKWHIEAQHSFGKSAVVLRATDDQHTSAAVKVFDPELVERFGKETQLKRIERELSLRGNIHPHLVEILDGGECPHTHHLFVAMLFIDAPSLGAVLQDVPRPRIFPIISQVAAAARHLEHLQVAHRDIKPDNIVISTDFEKATLMDLGVLRPIGEAGLTDNDQRLFIGTLRYSPPEYLFRAEEDTLEGWRAITFYQLGAVLHDLIQRAPLFFEFSEPFARLVDAVKLEIPRFDMADVPPDLILLAKNCLQKRADLRLRLVHWDDFQPRDPKPSLIVQAKERINKRRAAALDSMSPVIASADELLARTARHTLSALVLQIETAIRHECSGDTLHFPPLYLAQQSLTPTTAYIFVSFEPSPHYGLLSCLSVWFSIRLLDADTHTLELQCASALSPARPSADITIPALVPTFEGAFENTVVSTRVQQVLYVALDYAQASKPQSTLAWLPLADLTRS